MAVPLLVAIRHYKRTHHPEDQWSTSIYVGDSPFNLHPLPGVTHPLLSKDNIAPEQVIDVGDSFLARKDDLWYLFVEVVGAVDHHGCIGYAVSTNLTQWTWRGIVLREPFHLSYPYVFEWDHEWFMIPESRQAGDIRLYKAQAFPAKWTLVASLIKGEYRDSSIIRHDNKWWIFTSGYQGKLYLYYADTLTGPWTAHPGNPVRQDWHTTRGGGRIIDYQGRLYRFVQDGIPGYGCQTFAMEITALTPGTFSERMVGTNAILKASGTGWNAIGMHTIDPHQISGTNWVAAVDGLRVYVPSDSREVHQP
ncbi:MAG: hypothetical protein WCO77_09975 [bacterium]